MSTVKFVGAKLSRVVMPKMDPTWRFALGVRPECIGLLLQLRDTRGLIGKGYASEIPHLGYDIDMLEAVATRHLGRVLQLGPNERRSIVGDPWRPTLPGPVRAMFDMAVWDLLGQAAEAPVYALLGGSPVDPIPVNRILSIKAPDVMAKKAAELVGEGYRNLKIKIDASPRALDADRIRAIRHAVGPDVTLTIDANQSYSPKPAVLLTDDIADCDVALFEQPVPRPDFDGLTYVTKHASIPVEADESADSLISVQRLARTRAVDMVSLKLSKLGGIDALVLAAQICRSEGIATRIGAHVGSRLMNAAAIHAAVSAPITFRAGELGEFARLNGDVATGLDVVDGSVAVPSGAGLGVDLLPSDADSMPWITPDD